MAVSSVMPGQERVFALAVPGIHVLTALKQEDVDGRNKSGHDEHSRQRHDEQPAQLVFAVCGGVAVVTNCVASSMAVPNGVGITTR